MVGFAVCSGSTVTNSSSSKPQVNSHLLDLCTSGSCWHDVFMLRDVGSCLKGSSGASLLAWFSLKSMWIYFYFTFFFFFEGGSTFQTSSVLTFPDGRVSLYPVSLWNVPPGVSAYIAADVTCIYAFILVNAAGSGLWQVTWLQSVCVESWENLITYSLNKECFHEELSS